MSDLSEGLLYRFIYPVAVGAVGLISGVVGVKIRIASLEKRYKELKSSVRYSDTCEEMHRSLTNRLEEMKESNRATQKEVTTVREGIATLLERTKKL